MRNDSWLRSAVTDTVTSFHETYAVHGSRAVSAAPASYPGTNFSSKFSTKNRAPFWVTTATSRGDGIAMVPSPWRLIMRAGMGLTTGKPWSNANLSPQDFFAFTLVPQTKNSFPVLFHSLPDNLMSGEIWKRAAWRGAWMRGSHWPRALASQALPCAARRGGRITLLPPPPCSSLPSISAFPGYRDDRSGKARRFSIHEQSCVCNRSSRFDSF